MFGPALRAAFAAAILSLLGTAPSFAQSFDDVLDVTVRPGWRTASGTHMAALQIDLKQGWKTYWRTPGEAGIPPRFAWGRSRNLHAVRVHWPVPSVFVDYGMRTIGYQDGVVIPVEFTPKKTGAPIHLKADIELGVCDDICIPMQVSVEAMLTGTEEGRDPLIDASLRTRPISAHKAGVRAVTCRVDPISDGLRLTAEIEMPPAGRAEVAVVELDGMAVWISEPKTTRKGNRLMAVSDLVPSTAQPFSLDRSRLRFTILGGDRAVDIQGCTG